jgi:DNA-binding NtrC family response regulator
VLAAFSGYGWPGNVRELKNVISRMVLSTSERDLRFSHLPDELKCAPNGLKTNLAQISDGVPVEEKMATFDDVEKETIVKALKATQWNRTRAAEALGISRRTIINKIHKWNLSPTGVAR